MSDTVSLKNFADRAQNEHAIPPSPFPTRSVRFCGFPLLESWKESFVVGNYPQEQVAKEAHKGWG